MVFDGLRRHLQTIKLALLLTLAFSLPVSSTLVSLLALSVAVCWIAEGGMRDKWREIRTNPVSMAVLVYLGAHVLGLAWSESLVSGLQVLHSQWKILLLPVFLTALSWEKRGWVVSAYVAGVTAVLLLITAAWLGLLSFGGVVNGKWQSSVVIIWNHIVFTPMLALAVYLVVHQLLWGEDVGCTRWGLILLGCFLLFGVFITQGRAGQLVLLPLIMLLVAQRFPRYWFKAALVSCLAMLVVVSVAYVSSTVFRQRMDIVRQDLATLDQNPEKTGTGLRLYFWQNTLRLIQANPWFGVGTGGFAAAYEQVNQQRTQGRFPTDNPHNQYLLVTARLGVFGLFCLLGLFGAQMYQAQRIQDGWTRIRLAFPVFFLVIMLTESYLVTQSSSMLFSLLGAVLFKQQVPGPSLAETVEPGASSLNQPSDADSPETDFIPTGSP